MGDIGVDFIYSGVYFLGGSLLASNHVGIFTRVAIFEVGRGVVACVRN